jgi:hypothetical protein
MGQIAITLTPTIGAGSTATIGKPPAVVGTALFEMLRGPQGLPGIQGAPGASVTWAIQTANYIIQNVPVRPGEIFAVGDSVGIDGAGNALKMSRPTFNTLWNGGAAIFSGPFAFEYAVDKLLIYFNTASTQYFVFYDRVSDTVLNTYSNTLDGVNADGMVHAKTLPSGEVACIVKGTSGYNAYKFTTVGVLVGHCIVALNFNSCPVIVPSPNNGEFFVTYFTYDTWHFNAARITSAVAVSGTYKNTSGALDSANTGVVGIQWAVGATTVCIISGNANDAGWVVVLNATTCAAIAPVNYQGPSVVGSPGPIYDAINAKYRVLWSVPNGISEGVIPESTGVQAAGFIFLPGAENCQFCSSTSWWLSSTAYLWSAVASSQTAYVLRYSADSGGTWTATLVTGIRNLTFIAVTPNFGYDKIWSSNGGFADYPAPMGATIAWVTPATDTFQNGPYVPSPPTHAYTIDPITAVARPIFSYSQNPKDSYLPARFANGTFVNLHVASRWDSGVMPMPVIDGATQNCKIVVSRFPAAVAYGVSKSAGTTVITVDLSQIDTTNVDVTVTPIRSRGSVMLGGIEYSTGGV